MPIELPFIGQVDEKEQKLWIKAINSAAERFKLLPLESMSPDATSTTTVASVSIVRLKDPQMAESMAEAVLAWTLYLHRKMPQYRALQSQKQWQQLSLSTPQECNVSLFGLGKLGSVAALRLKQNNFTVRGWSRNEKSLDGIQTFHGSNGFDSILADTTDLFNSNAFLTMPTGASVINFARGPVINESYLLEALTSQHLHHAVLDVFDEEPLPANHAFWTHPDVTVLPHISAPTTVSTAAAITAKNIDNYLASGDIPEAVDRNKGY